LDRTQEADHVQDTNDDDEYIDDDDYVDDDDSGSGVGGFFSNWFGSSDDD